MWQLSQWMQFVVLNTLRCRLISKVVQLLILSDEKAGQLRSIMLGEINGEEKVGMKYRVDEKARQEGVVLPIDWLKTNGSWSNFERKN